MRSELLYRCVLVGERYITQLWIMGHTYACSTLYMIRLATNKPMLLLFGHHALSISDKAEVITLRANFFFFMVSIQRSEAFRLSSTRSHGAFLVGGARQ